MVRRSTDDDLIRLCAGLLDHFCPFFHQLATTFPNLIEGLRKHSKGLALNAFGIALIIGILAFALTDSAPFSQVVALNSWVLLGYCMIHSRNKNNNDMTVKVNGINGDNKNFQMVR